MLSSSAHGPSDHSTRGRLAALTLGAVGVVYGDIGTSPLYALREAIHVVSGDGITDNEVMGITSLLIWFLILVVTVKYVIFMLRADNKGEGGILSLLALVLNVAGVRSSIIVWCGIIGAGLFYGDAVLTPAISVLSAVEGLKLVTPHVEPWILPITITILLGLFIIQRHGTGLVSKWFGPITLVWFLAIAACGYPYIVANPTVLNAFLPSFALSFLIEHQFVSFVVLGSVFLAVTGAEALYADMGHFGRTPIQLAWIWVVFPALIMNYLGQAAFILSNVEGAKDPFFLMVPQWALLPMICLATLATIIASQAVITGAFSLTRQAIQLGFLPRFEIRHTSAKESGQIFLPRINMILMVGVLYLVLEFKTSSALASAYGIAVSGTMLITTMLAGFVIRYIWKRSAVFTMMVIFPFLVIETVFVSSNMMKVADGGYIPLIIAATVITLMICWRRGTRQIQAKEVKLSIPLEDFLGTLSGSSVKYVNGTAIFLTQDPTITPSALLHNLKHNKVLHNQNIILSVVTETTPRVDPLNRTQIQVINDRFIVIRVHFGYMETPHVSKALHICKKVGVSFDIMATSFFVSRRSMRTNAKGMLNRWVDKIFIMLSRNATRPSDFFHIPTDRVVEIGTQVNL